MNIEQLKEELLKDPKFKKEYYRKDDLSFEIADQIVSVRIKKGLTQKELARKVGTQQSSIARLESGDSMPSLSFLQKIAKAVGSYLIAPRFSILVDDNATTINEDEKFFEFYESPQRMLTCYIDSGFASSANCFSNKNNDNLNKQGVVDVVFNHKPLY